jgi:hypothetical protein
MRVPKTHRKKALAMSNRIQSVQPGVGLGDITNAFLINYFMAHVDKGAVLWARQTIESDIFFWKPPAWFKIWFYIVSRVNYKDTKQFKRGEGYFNWQEIKPNLHGVSRFQWTSCTRWLKKAKQITTHKTTRGNVISVVNYDKFQNIKNYKTKAENKAESKAGAKQKLHYNSNKEKKENIYMPFDELNDGDTTYEDLDSPSKKTKTPNRGKARCRIATHFMGLTGQTGNALRYFGDINELFSLAEKSLPGVTDERLEEEIVLRIDAAAKHYADWEGGTWGLNAVVKNWNLILKW